MAAWRMISTSPITEMSEVSLSVNCQTLPSPGSAKRGDLGNEDAKEALRPLIADGHGRLHLSPGHGEHRTPDDLGRVGAGADPDADRAGDEERRVDIALIAEHAGRDRAQRRPAAEEDQIDDQKLRDAADDGV